MPAVWLHLYSGVSCNRTMDWKLFVWKRACGKIYPYVKLYLPVFVFVQCFVEYSAWAWDAGVPVCTESNRESDSDLFRIFSDTSVWTESLSDGDAGKPDDDSGMFCRDFVEKAAEKTRMTGMNTANCVRF